MVFVIADGKNLIKCVCVVSLAVTISNMDNFEYRAVIKFLHLKGNLTKQIKGELDAEYGDTAPSLSMVKNWVAEFKQRGRTSMVVDEPSGGPKTATTEEIVNKRIQS